MEHLLILNARNARIAGLLLALMPGGHAITECPLSTSDGVKAVDVAWIASAREELDHKPIVLERAPEICVEICSPSNTVSEFTEKRALYFDAGAEEVWICGLDGALRFYVTPGELVDASRLCPQFPREVA